VEHSEGKGGERAVAIPKFQGGNPHICRLRTTLFWPGGQGLSCTDHMSGFMGPGLSFPALRWFVGGRMRQLRMTAGPDDRWKPRLHPGSRDPILI
jgi:hypothetical protein